MANAQAHVRAPKPYCIGSGFSMWLKHFEPYARALKLKEGHMCNAMLSLLDDATFCAYDLLGLGESDTQDYGQLVQSTS